jgi:hypothetical protein
MKTKNKIAFATTLAAILVAATAYARPLYSISYTYYSDAAHSYTVGGADFTCANKMVYWGEQTPYRSEDMKLACSTTGPELPGTNDGYP